jgi:hypothetical protein
MADTLETDWRAGAAERDITPETGVFLFGYPHVQRISTGVHDPLSVSALYLAGRGTALWVSCDLIWLPRALVTRARQRISDRTHLSMDQIMLTATHTHSGPVMSTMLSNAEDPVVPGPDPAYQHRVEQAIVDAACEAAQQATPAEVVHAVADGRGLGTNRRDPDGPAMPQVPVIAARDLATGRFRAIMAVVSMHPTVLHEDSTLISGDFPGLARQHLKQKSLSSGCPFVYHMGASGNQSPRHVVASNSFDEADRLGHRLSESIESALNQARPLTANITTDYYEIDLPRRILPAVPEAERLAKQARARLEALRQRGTPRAECRKAEVDWFGAKETLTLARAAEAGHLEEAARSCLPAEIQAIDIGGLRFVGWPGEVFVEFAWQVMAEWPDTYIITLANGELQGYLVTEQAVSEGAYEAGNAIFASPESGQRLVSVTHSLLTKLPQPSTRARP